MRDIQSREEFRQTVSKEEITYKYSVLAVGPSAPPFNGMSIMTQAILQNSAKELHLIHLDTADRRSISNVGRLDLLNVLLALWHGLRFLYLTLIKCPDVVYVPISQMALPFLRDCLFLLPARFLRKHVVVHLHGGYFPQFFSKSSAPMRWLIGLSLKNSTAVVLGHSLVSVFDGIIPRERVHVVPNGVSDLLREEMRDMAEDRPFTVLYLSLLASEKGVFDVLRSIPLIVKQVNRCRFVFAGEWYRDEERREASDLIKRLGIERYVEYVGIADPSSKIKLLNAADLFVLPSYNEGQPCAILEAMSVGLPIIATNTGCISETVVDGVNGFLVETGNPAEIAAKILLLHNEPGLRGNMQAASRERFLSHYTLDEFTDRLSKVLTNRRHELVVNERHEESVLP